MNLRKIRKMGKSKIENITLNGGYVYLKRAEPTRTRFDPHLMANS